MCACVSFRVCVSHEACVVPVCVCVCACVRLCACVVPGVTAIQSRNRDTGRIRCAPPPAPRRSSARPAAQSTPAAQIDSYFTRHICNLRLVISIRLYCVADRSGVRRGGVGGVRGNLRVSSGRRLGESGGRRLGESGGGDWGSLGRRLGESGEETGGVRG